jgi:tetratricopeptide (TPR) repeat protein
MAMGWHTFAEGEARRTIALFPDSPVAWRTQVNVQKELAHQDEARQACNKLLELDPDGVETLRCIAAFETECGRHAEAIAIYRRLIEDDPKRRGEWLPGAGRCSVSESSLHQTCMGLFLSSGCYWVSLTVLCSERESRSSSRRLRSSSRSARKGSGDRNASGAWRLAALASLVVSQRLDA